MVSFMSMLASLPEEVRANVISFLVPFLHRQGHECPVIATGVASRNHRGYTIAGYQIWNLQAATYVDDFTVWITARILRQIFDEWIFRAAGMGAHN